MSRVTKIDETFYEATGRRLSNVSQLKMFNLLMDAEENRFLNVWKSFSINPKAVSDSAYYSLHEVSSEDWWDNIAAYYYGSAYLWWVVCLANNVNNPFEELEEGRMLVILREETLYQLFKELKSLGAL
jgi:hypothetical protein